MPKRDTYNYTYRVGRKLSHREVINNPKRREKEYQRNRPGGKLTVDGKAKPHEGALIVEHQQSNLTGIIEQDDCDRFQKLADQWENETALLSSSDKAAEHPAHRAIVNMGTPVVSLILKRMHSQGGHWFHALYDITGAAPVKPIERGNVRAMQAAWQEWGKLNGYA